MRKKLEKVKKLVERQVTDGILYDVPSLMVPEARNAKIVMLAEHQEVNNFDFDESN